MSVEFVLSNQVVEVNGQNFYWPSEPNGIPKLIPCSDVEIINSFWKIPVTQGNRVIGFNTLVADGSNPPTPDSLKILRVKDRNQANVEYGFAIANTDNIYTTSPPNYFAFLCDGTGGTLPVMPTITIPVPIQQSLPQSTSSTGTNTFIFAFPPNPNGLTYSILYPWFNGAAPATPYAPSGITTIAGFITWANSNWGTYGTWSQVGSTNTVQLASPTTAGVYVSLAGVQPSLTPIEYCITFSGSAQNINGITIAGQNYPITPMAASTANIPQVWNAIMGYFQGATNSFATSGKLGITTVQLPQALTFNGVTVSGLTFAPGSC